MKVAVIYNKPEVHPSDVINLFIQKPLMKMLPQPAEASGRAPTAQRWKETWDASQASVVYGRPCH